MNNENGEKHANCANNVNYVRNDMISIADHERMRLLQY